MIRSSCKNLIQLLIRATPLYQGQISLDEEIGSEDDRTLADTLADSRDYYEESAHREATRQENEELSAVMAQFDVSFFDVADNCPKQERTMEACAKAIRYAGENKKLLDDLLRTKNCPLRSLCRAAVWSGKLWSGTESIFSPCF